MLSILLLVCASVIVECAAGVAGVSATCSMVAGSGSAPIAGTIKITQSSPESGVTVLVQLTGFNTSYPAGTLHGFHVHQNGLLTNKCVDAGPHFNPFNVSHSAPTDAIRHVGDLGNIAVDSNGAVNTTLTDNVVSLLGPCSVVGKSIVAKNVNKGIVIGMWTQTVQTFPSMIATNMKRRTHVHQTFDDLGLGNFSDSKTTGHAGGRFGCCLITLDNGSN